MLAAVMQETWHMYSSLLVTKSMHYLSIFYLDVMFTPQKTSSLEWLPLNIDVGFLHLNLQRHCAETRGQ